MNIIICHQKRQLSLHIFVTCEFNAMYRIGLIQTDNFTVKVGTIESIGPIILKIRKAKCWYISVETVGFKYSIISYLKILMWLTF